MSRLVRANPHVLPIIPSTSTHRFAWICVEVRGRRGSINGENHQDLELEEFVRFESAVTLNRSAQIFNPNGASGFAVIHLFCVVLQSPALLQSFNVVVHRNDGREKITCQLGTPDSAFVKTFADKTDSWGINTHSLVEMLNTRAHLYGRTERGKGQSAATGLTKRNRSRGPQELPQPPRLLSKCGRFRDCRNLLGCEIPVFFGNWTIHPITWLFSRCSIFGTLQRASKLQVIDREK